MHPAVRASTRATLPGTRFAGQAPVSPGGADEIAATRGEDISGYFTNRFTVVSRQAVIKTLLGRALSEEREHKSRVKSG